MMKPFLLLLALGACSLPRSSHAQNIGINANGSMPDASAMLDIDVSAVAGPKRGLLIPRMTSAQRTGIPGPATGLLVFDTTTNGFWYWNGTAWTTLWTGASGWGLSGNTGTTPATNFIGTTDNAPLHFRVDNVTAGRIAPADSVVALGARAGGSLTTGRYNTFIGQLAGSSTTTGNRNTFVGNEAGALNTADRNTFIGHRSGTGNTVGADNAFLGFWSGQYTTTGSANVFLGSEAGRLNTTGAFNTFMGYRSGYATTTAQFNTFVGNSSGMSNTTGTVNTFVGSAAGIANITGNSNVFIGSVAGRENTTGSGNTYVGTNAGYEGTAASGNSFFGHQAGEACSGHWNVAVGMFAGSGPASGARNTYIGYQADGGPAVTNATAIGSNALVTTSNSLVLGGTGANAVQVGIGVTAPTAELEVNGYTKLGSDAPAIRMKKLAGTSAATQGGSVTIPHGLNGTRILAVEVLLEWSTGAWLHHSYTNATGYVFNYYHTATGIVVINESGDSANILTKPLKVLVTYEE